MFTGIVADRGRVAAVETTGSDSRLRIITSLAEGMQVGDSIAVNGVCLTATELGADWFSVDVVQETLRRTTLGSVVVDDGVNLERPVPANGLLDGHIVQGHVDGVAPVIGAEEEGHGLRLRVGLPGSLARYVVEKGSITIDGVSLTVAAVSPPRDPEPWCEVALIPHTIEVTVLGERPVGAEVNLEIDVLAKYVERLVETSA